MLSTILTKTKTIVDTISAGILPIKSAFLETMPSAFPAAALTYESHKEEKLDTITNKVSSRFLLRVLFPTEERLEAQAKWLALVDALGAELRKDDHQTLTGTAVNFGVTDGGSAITLDYGQPIIVFTLIIKADYLTLITS
jgi:hypothetical protein